MAEWKVTRMIRKEKVYALCNRLDLYTRGDCKAYENMLNILCDVSSPILDDYELILYDILNHSDLEPLYEKYGEDYDGITEILMNDLINDCSTFVVEKRR